MKKYTYIGLKVVFSLIILLPVVSQIGLLLGYNIEPKPEYYSTNEAFTFITVLMDAEYITIINSLVFIISLILLWTRRAGLAAVLCFPITLNIVAFHAFVDGGPFTGGALLGNIFFAINLYLFWYHWAQYRQLLSKDITNPV